jgi:hypothetical protein
VTESALRCDGADASAGSTRVGNMTCRAESFELLTALDGERERMNFSSLSLGDGMVMATRSMKETKKKADFDNTYNQATPTGQMV